MTVNHAQVSLLLLLIVINLKSRGDLSSLDKGMLMCPIHAQLASSYRFYNYFSNLNQDEVDKITVLIWLFLLGFCKCHLCSLFKACSLLCDNLLQFPSSMLYNLFYCFMHQWNKIVAFDSFCILNYDFFWCHLIHNRKKITI